MDIIRELTDASVLLEIGARLARRRVEAGFTQAALAREAAVAKRTVERIEAGHAAELGTLIRILRVLDLMAGLEALVPHQPPSPIALLKNRGRPRQRASGRRAGAARDGRAWTWAE